MSRSKTLKQKIESRFTKTKKTDVFVPKDFADFSGEDQVLRALRLLVRDGALLKLGYGVYPRAVRSRISGRLMVSSSNGFHSAAIQALNKLLELLGSRLKARRPTMKGDLRRFP